MPRRGRPRKDWNSKLVPTNTDQSCMEDKVTLHSIEAQLFDNFRHQTSKTLAERPPFSHLWQTSIPNFALSRPPEQACILNLLLSLSATQLHRVGFQLKIDSNNEYDYSVLSHSYLDRGASGLSKLIPQLYHTTGTEDSELRRTIFVSSLLVCYCTLAQGPTARDGEYLFFSNDGPGQWAPLLKGVKAVMDSTGSGFINLMGSLVADSTSEIQEQSQSTPKPPQDRRTPSEAIRWKHHLNELSTLIQEHSNCQMAAFGLYERRSDQSTENCALHEAYNGLYRYYNATFSDHYLAKDGTNPRTEPTDGGTEKDRGDYAHVLGWPFRLPSAITSLLSSGAKLHQSSRLPVPAILQSTEASQHQDSQILAFLLVAYFCPLLQTLDHEWFIQGWARHVLRGCREALERLSHASESQSYDSNTDTELVIEYKGNKVMAQAALKMLGWPELMLSVAC